MITLNGLNNSIKEYQIKNGRNPDEIELSPSHYWDICRDALQMEPSGEIMVGGIPIKVVPSKIEGVISFAPQ